VHNTSYGRRRVLGGIREVSSVATSDNREQNEIVHDDAVFRIHT